VHCAGLTPRTGTTWSEFSKVNVVGTSLLAEDAVRRGAKLFVYVSTAGRLGRRNSASKNTRLYVLSKYLAERRLRQLLRGQVPALSLRAASLYGEHDRGSMSRLIRGIAVGRFILPVVGEVPKCLLYAGSLASAIASEVTSASHEPWRARGIADLRTYSLGEIVAAIEGVLGKRASRIPLSVGVMSMGATVAESAGRLLAQRRLIEMAQAAKTALSPVLCRDDNLLRDHPGPHVELVEGVRREVEWMRASGGI
jgi:nucleoside-diphosphate-sugar epimerase